MQTNGAALSGKSDRRNLIRNILARLPGSIRRLLERHKTRRYTAPITPGALHFILALTDRSPVERKPGEESSGRHVPVRRTARFRLLPTQSIA
jgi:hypothetical protein